MFDFTRQVGRAGQWSWLLAPLAPVVGIVTFVHYGSWNSSFCWGSNAHLDEACTFSFITPSWAGQTHLGLHWPLNIIPAYQPNLGSLSYFNVWSLFPLHLLSYMMLSSLPHYKSSQVSVLHYSGITNAPPPSVVSDLLPSPTPQSHSSGLPCISPLPLCVSLIAALDSASICQDCWYTECITASFL